MVTDWARPETAQKLLTGERMITDEAGGWALIRNPLPPGQDAVLFSQIRRELSVSKHDFSTNRSHIDLSDDLRNDLREG